MESPTRPPDGTGPYSLRDEIGNLLIFAGLFSAVVTAFIIESYKSLFPDPNDDTINLLSQIPSDKNNTTTPNLPSPVFSPSRSIVGVSIFWFLSLVFSLAVVLIGIVALQWLREYQAYPSKSARETLTMYRMRSEGMENWHVWRILTALPLLLQIALVLFFAGIIDFLIALENKALVVSVTVVIGLILVFLVATTTLPALQAFILYTRLFFSFTFSSPPSRCPYKSPQARVFCALFDLSFRVPCSLSANLWYPSSHPDQSPARVFIYPPCGPNAPGPNDLAWLWVRDACSRGTHDKDFDVFPGQTGDNTHIMPLFDCIGAIREHLYNMDNDGCSLTIAGDAYHCFADLSSTFTISETSNHYWTGHLQDLVRRNQYLQFSFGRGSSSISGDCTTFDQLNLDKESDVHEAIRVLHERNMFIFLDKAKDEFPTQDMMVHLQEVRIRIQQYLFGRRSGILPDTSYPLDLELFRERAIPMADPRQATLSFQYMNVIRTFFTYLSNPATTTITQGDLHFHPNIAEFLSRASGQICVMVAFILQDSGSHDHEVRSQISNAYTDLLDSISTSLHCLTHAHAQVQVELEPTANTTEMATQVQARAHVLYYAAIYTEPIYQAFRTMEVMEVLQSDSHARLLSVIRTLKERTVDQLKHGEREMEIEGKFAVNREFGGAFGEESRFTPEWWAFLDVYRDDGHGTVESPSEMQG